MFGAWGSAAYRYRVPMLVVVVLAILAGGSWGMGVFDRMSTGGYEAPGSEAVVAKNLVSDKLGSQGDLVIVYSASQGQTVDDEKIANRITQSLNNLPSDAVNEVTSYWKTPAPPLVTPEHDRGIASINLAGSDVSAKIDSYKEIENKLEVDGVSTAVAGEIPLQVAVEEQSKSDLATAETVSLPIVLVLLVLIFGGVVAASLPVLVGGLAVFGALGLLRVISIFADVNAFAINVASLLGLGMAIDYGLFIVGRFREEMSGGRSTSESVRHAIGSAGRTVAFSATLLIIALAGLTLFPQDFLKSLGYGGMSAVILAAIISLTLLPALLAMLGHRVDSLGMPWRNRKSEKAGGGWQRFADGVMKRPLLTALPILALLGSLGAPALGVQFGSPDERMLPKDNSARQGIETLRDNFPDMSSSGIQVVIEGKPRPAEAQKLTAEIDKIPGIDGVTPGGQQDDVLLLNAALDSDPFGDRAKDAVTDIRELTPPNETKLLVTGPTAMNVDSLHATAEKLPLVGALLVGATLVLMFLAFGSVLLPIKAVVMSALSLSATFGALTWIFVGGNGADLIGVTPAPMEAGIVVLMASLVFGLSTDYEVFLLSRMVEARAHGASTTEAVRAGLASTGRMISAAALLLIVVTGAFAFSEITMMRFIGVGTIIALALDASVVRMVLVPAVIRLIGPAVWWAPGPLKRLQERVGIQEGEPAPPELEAVDNEAEPVDNSSEAETVLLPPVHDSPQVDPLPYGYAQPRRHPVDNPVDRPVGSQSGAWSAPLPGRPRRTHTANGVDSRVSGYLFGFVLDARGVPAPSVILTLTDSAGHQLESVQTDSSGHYRIGASRFGNYLLIASGEHQQPIASRVVLGNTAIRRDIRLRDALPSFRTWVGGVVRAPHVGPVQGARVTLLDATGTAIAVTTTDRDGSYAFAELPVGRYTVVATGYPPVAKSLRLTDRPAALDVELGYPNDAAQQGIPPDRRQHAR